MSAAESVTVSPDGKLILLDKYNHLYEGYPNTSDPTGYSLNPKPIAYLGQGRPLGFHFDHQGDLVSCDSLKVRPA